jgi:hypothetical protein
MLAVSTTQCNIRNLRFEANRIAKSQVSDRIAVAVDLTCFRVRFYGSDACSLAERGIPAHRLSRCLLRVCSRA